MQVSESPIRNAEFHEIYVRNDSHAWCRLLWQDDGWVIILSDYGHWAFWWGHRGKGISVSRFLAKLDREYMGGKMMGADLYEYSVESTVKCIRETIVEYRKAGVMTKDDARSEWDLSEQLESDGIAFSEWCGESSLGDGYECHRKEICNTWVQFWSRLWVPLIRPLLESGSE